MGINLGSLCREPSKLALLTSGNPGNEGAPALAGGGEMVRKVTFVLKLSLRLAGSPPPSIEGGKGCTVAFNVGRGLLPPTRRKSNFTYGKSQRLLRRSLHVVQVLHRLASVDCHNSLENAWFPQQNFATLRMTYSRFAFYMATHTAANYSFSTREKNVMCCDARRGATQFARIKWS